MASNEVVLATRRRVALTLEGMAKKGAASPVVQKLVSNIALLPFLSLPQRLQVVWQWLPTRYVSDRDGDNWQSAEETFARGQGDCEDWAVLLCALLKAMDVDAHIGVMPNHAAAFVRVRVPWPGQYAASHRNAVPPTWRTVQHRGGLWLALESTTAPQTRQPPGWDDELISPWLNTDQLWIAE